MLLAFLWTIRTEQIASQQVIRVVSNLADADKTEEFKEELESFRVDDAKAAAKFDLTKLATKASLSDAGGAPTRVNGGLAAGPVVAAIAAHKLGVQAIRPLQSTGIASGRGSELKGILGTTVETVGDVQSVDYITREIKRQLEKNKVLVIWLMDATLSLEKRRQVAIERFDRVYGELSALDQDRDQALLTAVVAFGKNVILMTPKPTADQNAVKQAVRNIRNDVSGIENIYTAIRQSYDKLRSYQRTERRKVMMILLTDEIGRDVAQLDDAVELVQRNQVSVYVLGPMAPFGRREVPVYWTDEPTGESFELKVRRGPESCQVEHLALPYWSNGENFELFPSGFGPYGLTRLTRASGGMYFVFDDQLIPGPRFSFYDLLEYEPDYQSASEYVRTMSKHPLRMAVIRAVEESRGARQAPPIRFNAEGLANQLRSAQEAAAETEAYVRRAAAELEAVEKLRAKESSKRWRAHYDLMLGRLLSAKVRCGEYNWSLAQMRVAPRAFANPKNNAWELKPDSQIAYGKKSTPEQGKAKSNVRRADAKATEKAKAEADKAMSYLGRVVAEHERTPWGMMAQRELDTPLGFRWEETYIVPPVRDNRPPTADQKAEMDRQRRRAEALKRAPKL